MIKLRYTSQNMYLTCSFIAALIVANVSGPQYIYPTFGTSLKERFKWTALENSLVGTACFIGVSFSGPLCAWMIESLGMKKTLRISAFLAFCGPFLVAQTYAGRLPGNFLCCTFYFICTGFAGAAAYLCALDSQSHNFKQHRGLSMGLVTASVGTCGVVFSQINDLLFGTDNYSQNTTITNDSTYDFLIFLSFTMATGIFLGSFFLGPVSSSTIIYEVLVDQEEAQEHQSSTEDIPNIHFLESLDPHSNKSEQDQKNVVSISGLEFLKHPVGFALFCTLFVVLGVGYVYLANIGQILNAISATESSQHIRNFHITLFSLGNCGSRVIFGALSDIMRNRFGVHRIWIFVLAVMLMLASLNFIVSETVTTDTLVFCTLVISSAYGIVFGVGPAATTEFGTETFARNWGLLLFAPAFGSQLFNILFGLFYGHEAEKQKSHECHGVKCYRDTFQLGIFCGVIALSILAMAIYKAGLYKNRIPAQSIN